MKTFTTNILAGVLLLPLATAVTALAQVDPPSERSAPIPMDQLGAVAGQHYQGDALGITATAEGARLRCGFQKLAGRATTEGLWLESTAPGDASKLRVVATTVGRAGDGGEDFAYTHSISRPIEFPPGFGVRWQSGATTPLFEGEQMGQTALTSESGVARCFPPQSKMLPRTGKVAVADQLVRFTRPGLTEEYSVSVDGVRQDFVIAERPAGTGDLRVELALSGARAEASAMGSGTATGAKLMLEGSGRTLAYSRLRATDANGKELPARIEVASGILPAATSLLVLVDDTEAVYPIRIDPTFSDADWVSLNQLPGAHRHILAVTADGSGNIYVGGWFTVVGNVKASHVAMWDGSSWSALGSGVDSDVCALAVSGNDVYAGGRFSVAGGVPAQRIAKWNGSSWSALGSGMSGTVYALAADGTDLYAGGSFSAAGGVTVNNIAKWNGSNWSALGSGVGNLVRTLAVSGSDLYVGGDFKTAGGVSAKYIARWNGSSWSALGSGLNDAPWTLAASGTDVYAGGSFTAAGGMSANHIAKWNGSSWSALGTGVDGTVGAMALSGTDLYIGGGFTTAGGVSAKNIARWNGSRWAALGSGMNGFVHQLVLSGGDLYAGGEFFTAGGVPAYKIARWNGSNWSSLGSGIPYEVLALAVSGTDLYAAGAAFADLPMCLIYKWNGSNWSALGSGMNAPVFALAVNGTDVYAGGGFTTAGGISANGIAKWDGSSWSALGSGMSGNVFALAVSGSDLYAAGGVTTAGGVLANYIAKWNGSSWSALGLGTDGGIFALAVSGSDLYAGGIFTVAGGVSANNIAKWNGSRWSALGSGTDGSIYALAVSGTDLYVGGFLTTAGGVPANNIAKWNGSSWSALGSGTDRNIQALAASGTDVYAGGWFATAGGVPANHIAKWDGSTWSALGSGVNGEVRALAADNRALAADNLGHLFVAGGFIEAGNMVSPYIAQANIDGLDFTWDAIASPQKAGIPFPVTLTARNTAGDILTSYTNAVTLSGHAPGLTNLTLGDGTGDWGYPLHTRYHDARTQVIYLTNELGRPCTLSSLALEVTTPPGQTLENWTIRMKHTALTEYSAAPEWDGSGWTVVYQGAEPAGGTGWRTFKFSTPFEYNGTNNLLVDFSFNNAAYSSEGSCRSTLMGAYRSLTYASDSKDGDPLSWTGITPTPVRSYNVPNVVLGAIYPDLLPVTISPTVTTPFVNGVWTGTVTVREAVSGMFLQASDGLGHLGASNPFDVQGTVQPPVILTGDGQMGIANGLFFFNVQGQPGQAVVIQVSTNLVDWLPLQTIVCSSAPFYFVDPDTSLFSQRFYRVLTP